MIPSPRVFRASRLLALGAPLIVAACAGAHPVEAPVVEAHLAPTPAPSGIFSVGTVLLDVLDTRAPQDQPAGLSSIIEAQVWYPAPHGGRGQRMPYFARPDVLTRLLAEGYFGQPRERLTTWARLESHAVQATRPAARRGGFPLVLFAPSRLVPASQYSALVQDLASHGAVVIAVPPRTSETPAFRRASYDVASFRGRETQTIAERAADLSIVLRRFVSARGSVGAIARRMDLTRAGALGHADGALVALATCAIEPVTTRCAAIDGVPDAGHGRVRVPLLVLASSPDTSTRAVRTPAASSVELWRSVLDAERDAPTALFALDGASTMTLTDAPYFMPAVPGALGQRGEPTLLLRAAVDALTAFFQERQDPIGAVDAAAAGMTSLAREL